MKLMNRIMPMTSRIMATMTIGLTEPDAPPSKSCVKNWGICATIPAMMISDVPLPIPREVICSPSHRRNMVPPIRLMTAEMRNIMLGRTTA
jgi:hypothetical protein